MSGEAREMIKSCQGAVGCAIMGTEARTEG